MKKLYDDFCRLEESISDLKEEIVTLNNTKSSKIEKDFLLILLIRFKRALREVSNELKKI